MFKSIVDTMCPNINAFCRLVLTDVAQVVSRSAAEDDLGWRIHLEREIIGPLVNDLVVSKNSKGNPGSPGSRHFHLPRL